MKIILASASPRRRDILKNANIPFEVLVSDADENINEKNPEKFTLEIARRKAEAIKNESDIIIAADTAVACGGEIMGKPKDKDDAKRMLSLLSGRRHSVYTGVCVKKGSKCVLFCEKSDVYFKKITEKEIENYIESGEPFGKAGAYAIQGLGAVLISEISGDYLNIVGLPLSRLYSVLKEEFSFEGSI